MTRTYRLNMALLWPALAALAFAMTAGGAEARPVSPIDFGKAWFMPTLVQGSGPLCEEAGAYARELFTSGASLSELPWRSFSLPGLEPLDPDEDLEAETPSATDPAARGAASTEQRYVVTHGRKLYIASVVSPGTCGGACERSAFYVSPTPFPPGRPGEFLRTLPPPSPAVSISHLLRKGDDYYVALIDDDAFRLLHLEPSGEWSPSCRVRLRPDEAARKLVPGLDEAAQSIDALRTAVRGLTRGAGPSCGSMQTHWRWDAYVSESLDELLYRPHPVSRFNDDGDSTYATDMRHMARWALTGVSEHDALLAYEAQLDETAGRLADFYVRNFGMAPAEARDRAIAGLTSAVSGGIRFYSYDPFASPEEERVRDAILQHRPMAEIRKIGLTPEAIDGDPENWWSRGESLLNAAVRYPEALAWLLELGADPNSANDFGKTPLMYAAQEDAVASARLLLAAGADPNAATIFPADHCYYSLSRASITALHYAVRYASPEMIELLLDHGAATYITTTPKGGEAGESPADWLRRYTAPGSEERNEAIPEEEVPRLAQLLAAPDEHELADLARARTLAAEEAYAAGDTARAYRLLKDALHAARDDARALSDMSLVALRAGHPGEAAGAALRLLAMDGAPDTKASAWFNLGLACEDPGARYGVRHNDSFPCTYSKVYPFLRAWELHPTPARAEKLKTVFAEHATCVERRGDAEVLYYLDRNGRDRGHGDAAGSGRYAYVRHPSDVAPFGAGNALAGGGFPLPLQPEARARHELGDFAITVYESAYAEIALKAGAIRCEEQS